SSLPYFFFFFFFNDTATTEIYTLSLHDALPICRKQQVPRTSNWTRTPVCDRSEDHTSELQSHHDLVCRLLLEKKKKNKLQINIVKKKKNIKKKTIIKNNK